MRQDSFLYSNGLRRMHFVTCRNHIQPTIQRELFYTTRFRSTLAEFKNEASSILSWDNKFYFFKTIRLRPYSRRDTEATTVTRCDRSCCDCLFPNILTLYVYLSCDWYRYVSICVSTFIIFNWRLRYIVFQCRKIFKRT